MGADGCGGRCRCKRGSLGGAFAGIVAKALTLVLLAAGVGAAHSVWQPIKLHPEPTAPIDINLPGRTPAPTPDPPSGNGTTEPGIEPAEQPAQVDPGADPGDPQPEPGTITLGDYVDLDTTRLLWEHGIAQFIDARRLDEYAAGHIPRALLVEPGAISSGRMPDGLMALDVDAVTVIYCGGGDCDASEHAKRDLQLMGFTQLHIFKDGFPVWDAARLPVNIGEPAASAPRPTAAPSGPGRR